MFQLLCLCFFDGAFWDERERGGFPAEGDQFPGFDGPDPPTHRRGFSFLIHRSTKPCPSHRGGAAPTHGSGLMKAGARHAS